MKKVNGNDVHYLYVDNAWNWGAWGPWGLGYWAGPGYGTGYRGW